MKLAADHAQRMASMDKMSHTLPGEGSFSQRIAAGGFQASMAAENVAAGQKTLAEVFEAWRKSPGHNANMLLPNVSLMGIALAIQPGGRYHTYWSLELGERFVPPAGGPRDRGRDRPSASAAQRSAGRPLATVRSTRQLSRSRNWRTLVRAASSARSAASPIENSVPPPGGPRTKVAMPRRSGHSVSIIG